MSIIKLTDDLKDLVSVTYRPAVEYNSSSANGITGLSTISPIATGRNRTIKDTERNKYVNTDTDLFDPIKIISEDEGRGYYNDSLIEKSQILGSKIDRYDFKVDMSNNAKLIKAQVLFSIMDKDDYRRGEKKIEDSLSISGGGYDLVYLTESLRSWESTILYENLKNVLYPFYNSRYNELHFGYANYNSLNFFTGDSVNNDTCLIYPNRSIGLNTIAGALKSSKSEERVYTPDDRFTLDFFINPRYSVSSTEEYTPGTIFHLSSSLALSIVSGSSRDANGEIETYKLMLQLSQSADIAPKDVDMSTISNLDAGSPAIYLSGDNLIKDHWHRVTINWQGNINTGSFQIDDKVTKFVFPSSSIKNENDLNGQDAVFIGNFYEGSGDLVERFFNTAAKNRNGIFEEYLNGFEYLADNKIEPAIDSEPPNSDYSFSHPLNAEIHDIKLYHISLKKSELDYISKNGVDKTNMPEMYIPGYFTPNVPKRIVQLSRSANSSIKTYVDATTSTNLNFNLGFGGHYLNLENFTKEFIYKNMPRLHNLTASVESVAEHNADISKSTNEYIYEQASMRKRNLTVLPCDNGKCVPNYSLLEDDIIRGTKFTPNILDGEINYRKISNITPFFDMSRYRDKNIINMFNFARQNSEPANSVIGHYVYPHRKLIKTSDHSDINSNLATIATGYAIKGSDSLGDSLSHNQNYLHAKIFNETDENNLTIFSFSNLLYGETVHPETFTLIDNNLTGSSEKIKITLRDDGEGSLYRHDSKTKPAKWASIGNILYNEGLAIVKHPSLKFMGSDDYSVSFRGEQTTHILTINAPAPRDLILSSSNDSYQILSASSDFDDANNKFIYIDSVNIHDENLNVIMRTNLAQPVIKRRNDEFMFKIKMDF